MSKVVVVHGIVLCAMMLSTWVVVGFTTTPANLNTGTGTGSGVSTIGMSSISSSMMSRHRQGMLLYSNSGFQQEYSDDDNEDSNIINSEFQAMTLEDLKSVCRENGLKVSGKKSDLVERLDEHFISTEGSFQSGDISDILDAIKNDKSDAQMTSEKDVSGETVEVTIVQQLQESCREYGLDESGTKVQLIERLDQFFRSESMTSESKEDELNGKEINDNEQYQTSVSEQNKSFESQDNPTQQREHDDDWTSYYPEVQSDDTYEDRVHEPDVQPFYGRDNMRDRNNNQPQFTVLVVPSQEQYGYTSYAPRDSFQKYRQFIQEAEEKNRVGKADPAAVRERMRGNKSRQNTNERRYTGQPRNDQRYQAGAQSSFNDKKSVRTANPSEAREIMRGRNVNRENDISSEARERAFTRAMEAEASMRQGRYQPSFDVNEQVRTSNPAEIRSITRIGGQDTQRTSDQQYNQSYQMKQERDEVEREIDQFEQERSQKEQDVINLERELASLQEKLYQMKYGQFMDGRPRAGTGREPSFSMNEKGKQVSPADARNMMRGGSIGGNNQRSKTASKSTRSRNWQNREESASRRRQSQVHSRIDMNKKVQKVDPVEARRSMRGEYRMQETRFSSKTYPSDKETTRRASPAEARELMRGEEVYDNDDNFRNYDGDETKRKKIYKNSFNMNEKVRKANPAEARVIMRGEQIYEPTIIKRTQNVYPINNYNSRQERRDRRLSFDMNERPVNPFVSRDVMRGYPGPPYANNFQNFQQGPWNDSGAYNFDTYQYPQNQRRDRSVSFDMNKRSNRANPAEARDIMRGYQSDQNPFINNRNYQSQRGMGNGANENNFYQRGSRDSMSFNMNEQYDRRRNPFIARDMMGSPQGPPYANGYRYQGPNNRNSYQDPPYSNAYRYRGPQYSNGYQTGTERMWNGEGVYDYDSYLRQQRRDRSVSFNVNERPIRANPMDAREMMRGYNNFF